MNCAPGFVAPLMEGPLDIIGDVHGELEVLERLLAHLGYDSAGNCAEGRRLVFLGDLIDRGPDSPGVVDKVMELIMRGKAQCIMGNHELNILLERPLPGNGWFIQPNKSENPGEYTSRRIDPSKREDYIRFFASLPLALENKALRLVHACWHAPSIARLRHAMKSGASAIDMYRRFEAEVAEELQDADLSSILNQERTVYAVSLNDPNWSPQPLPAHAEADVIRQMRNPMRVLTTSQVQMARNPFFAHGAWRMVQYARWWDHYTDDVPIVIGHFWRLFDTVSERMSGVFGGDIFEGIPNHAWMGSRQNVYCVDYSVGQLHLERQRDPGAGQFHGKLAALRFPEWEVHHDDGTIISVK